MVRWREMLMRKIRLRKQNVNKYANLEENVNENVKIDENDNDDAKYGRHHIGDQGQHLKNKQTDLPMQTKWNCKRAAHD